MTRLPSRPERRGFTLTELLVVIAIILIVSVATLPVVLPALNQRQVSESALLLQAELSRARDQAVRSNAPRGFRLLPSSDPRFAFFDYSKLSNSADDDGDGLTDELDESYRPTPAYDRMIPIEAGPVYREGTFTYKKPVSSLVPAGITDPATGVAVIGGSASDFRYRPTLNSPFTHPLGSNTAAFSYGMMGTDSVFRRTWQVIFETKQRQVGTAGPFVPTNPTSWFWNLRRGDKIRLGGDQRELTVVGPMLVPKGPNNPEGFINFGPQSTVPGLPPPYQSLPNQPLQEFLVVLDGIDNPEPHSILPTLIPDGYVDEAFDGIDNDGDGIIDPGFNGLDDNGNGIYDEPAEVLLSRTSAGAFIYLGLEWEPEADLTNTQAPTGSTVPITDEDLRYAAYPGVVVSRGAREINLPGGAVIDMTTWNTTGERSRLPVNPQTGNVDILVAPSGQLLQPFGGEFVPYPTSVPFIHFWITDVDGVVAPNDQTGNQVPYLLPMPEGTPGYPLRASMGTGALLDTTGRKLEGNQRLVSVNTRTGQIVTTTPVFDIRDWDADQTASNHNPAALERPYLDAQAGVKGVE